MMLSSNFSSIVNKDLIRIVPVSFFITFNGVGERDENSVPGENSVAEEISPALLSLATLLLVDIVITGVLVCSYRLPKTWYESFVKPPTLIGLCFCS